MTEKRPKSQHQSRRTGDVECEEHPDQSTIKEAESETVWPIQRLREERKSGIQAGNIAEVENSSHLSRFAVRTLLRLERTKLRTTPRDPEEIEGNLDWQVERIVKREIISYMRKVRGRDKPIKERGYFVQWKGCADDENTYEPPEGMQNSQEEVETFQRESPEIPGLREVE